MNELSPEESSEEDLSIDSSERQSVKQDASVTEISRYQESSAFVGPIPPPAILDRYNQILPGAADRILTMAEKEQAHRHKMQEKLVQSQVFDFQQERNEKRLGQIFGFAIGVVSIIAGSVTAVKGAPWAGGFIGSAGVVGLVSVFVVGRKDQRNAQNFQQIEDEWLEDE